MPESDRNPSPPSDASRRIDQTLDRLLETLDRAVADSPAKTHQERYLVANAIGVGAFRTLGALAPDGIRPEHLTRLRSWSETYSRPRAEREK